MFTLSNLKFRLGITLLSWGSQLVFTNDDSKQLFKDAVNRNTLIGSHIETGNHLTGYVQPMCEYDTQSVINVLNQKLLINEDAAFVGMSITEKHEYYKETWKY
jgi:hypothetical protein